MCDFFELIRNHESVCIAGMCKNAGKTTVLNAFLDACHQRGRNVAVTSIGRDGESNDVVFGTAKPEVFLRRGDLAATAKALLHHCTVTREILCATGIPTPLGEVVVFRALSDGFVQIAGPSIVAQLSETKCLFLRFGAENVFFDGALGRKSLCGETVADGVVLVSGASLSKDMDIVVKETAFVARMLDLPALDLSVAHLLKGEKRDLCLCAGEKRLLGPDGELPGGAELLFVAGALTDRHKPLLEVAAKRNQPIAVESGASVLADRAMVEEFLRAGGRLLQLSRVKLLGVAVNPVSVFGYGFDAMSFENSIRAAVSVPVFNVKEVL